MNQSTFKVDELLELIRRGESVNVDFKETLSKEVLEDLSSDMAAFANAEGGRIIIGVRGRRVPEDIVGYEVQKKDKERIAQEARNCQPPVSLRVEENIAHGKKLLVMTVPKSKMIHTDKHRRFPIRIGETKDYLDITGILLLARERLGVSYKEAEIETLIEARPRPEATSEEIDLCLNLLKDLDEETRAQGAIELLNLSYDKDIAYNSRVLEMLKVSLKDQYEEVRLNAISVLRSILWKQKDERVKRRIANDNTGTIIQLALDDPNFRVRCEAMDLLVMISEKDAIEPLFQILTTCDEKDYKELHSPLKSALRKLSSGKHKLEIRGKLFSLLKNPSEVVKNRAKAMLEAVRTRSGF